MRKGLLLSAIILSLAVVSCDDSDSKKCEEGKFQCNGAVLQKCDGGKLVDQTTCANGSTCDASQGKCVTASEACTGDEKKCDGANYKVCTNSTFSTTACASAELCDATKGCLECKADTDCKDTKKTKCNTASNVCEEPSTQGCGADAKSCDGANYKVCSGDQLTTTTCASEALCDADKGCLECKNNEDCKNVQDKPSCDVATNTCVVASTAVCDNGNIDSGEECDGSKFKEGDSCASLTEDIYAVGNLRCTQCKVDITNCFYCGNNEKEERNAWESGYEVDEACDGTDIGEATCADFDPKITWASGEPGCHADCTKLTQGTCKQ